MSNYPPVETRGTEMPNMSPESLEAMEQIRIAIARRIGANPADVTMMISTPASEQALDEIAADLAELKAERDAIVARLAAKDSEVGNGRSE